MKLAAVGCLSCCSCSQRPVLLGRDTLESMALLYVWLPSLVFGHLLAACLLLYGIWHGLPSLGRRGQKTAGQHPRSSGQQPIQPHNLDDVFASHADLLAEVLDVQIDSPKVLTKEQHRFVPLWSRDPVSRLSAAACRLQRQQSRGSKLTKRHRTGSLCLSL